MKAITVPDNDSYPTLIADNQNDTSEAIKFILLQNMYHCFRFRFYKEKFIVITSSKTAHITYSIPIRQLNSDENNDNLSSNQTEFYFDSSKTTLFMFSNLHFKHVINDPFQLDKHTKKEYFEKYNQKALPDEDIVSIVNIDDVPLDNMLFIHLKFNARITFYDCLFINNSTKQFLILTQQNSVAQFLHCKFHGDFRFVALDNSTIMRE